MSLSACDAVQKLRRTSFPFGEELGPPKGIIFEAQDFLDCRSHRTVIHVRLATVNPHEPVCCLKDPMISTPCWIVLANLDVIVYTTVMEQLVMR